MMEDCAFSREEAEVLMTYTHTGMSRDEGDHLLRWARNQAYRSNRIRFASMRNLCAVISKRYHPEGIKSVNFWEPKDGKQHLVLYHRSLIGVLQRLLRHPRYAGVQYTSFRMLRTDQGVRVFGAFNNGEWYECAHLKAQTLGGGRPVSVVPYFMGSDVTVARKTMPMYPFYVCPGCIDDDRRSEPASWAIVAVFPHFNGKAAARAGRPPDGPHGYRRRRVLPFPICLSVCLADFKRCTQCGGTVVTVWSKCAAYLVHTGHFLNTLLTFWTYHQHFLSCLRL